MPTRNVLLQHVVVRTRLAVVSPLRLTSAHHTHEVQLRAIALVHVVVVNAVHDTFQRRASHEGDLRTVVVAVTAQNHHRLVHLEPVATVQEALFQRALVSWVWFRAHQSVLQRRLGVGGLDGGEAPRHRGRLGRLAEGGVPADGVGGGGRGGSCGAHACRVNTAGDAGSTGSTGSAGSAGSAGREDAGGDAAGRLRVGVAG